MSTVRIPPTLRAETQGAASVEASGETASFYVREGQSRVCLFRQNSPHAARHHLDEGSELPLTAGASTVPHFVGTPVTIAGNPTAYGAAAGDFATVSRTLTAPLDGLTPLSSRREVVA